MGISNRRQLAGREYRHTSVFKVANQEILADPVLRCSIAEVMMSKGNGLKFGVKSNIG
jgi:hypothetical protein